MLNKGIYHGYLKAGVTSTAQSGNEQVEITFNLQLVSNGQVWIPVEPPVDRTLFLSCAENAWQYTKRKLESLGFNGDFANPAFAEQCATEGVDLVCEHETYNNKPKERWDLLNWGEREVKQAETSKVMALNARWRSGARPPVPTGRPAAPPAAVSQAPVVMRQPPPPRPAMAAPPTRPATPPVPQQAQGELNLPTPSPEGTKDWAWDVFLNENAGEPDLTRWNAILATIGKPESQFTHEDWINVHREVLAQALPV
jgi:hypothetical protein